MSDFRVSMSHGTIGVVVRVTRALRAISVVSAVGRIVGGVRVFALCTTFTFVWRRFVGSGVIIWRVEVLVYDFLNVS